MEALTALLCFLLQSRDVIFSLFFLFCVCSGLTFANLSQLYIRWKDVSHIEVILIQHVGTAPPRVAKPDDQFTCTVSKNIYKSGLKTCLREASAQPRFILEGVFFGL